MPPWVTIGYVTFLLFPHHQPDPHVPRLPALPHQVLKGLYSNTYEGKNIQLPVSAEPCTPRCQEKGNENNHREDVLILLTLGNRKKKRLATEGWNTCYWIIVAFNVPQDFPGKNTGVSGHFFLPGIFLIQGSNQGLLHCG